MQARVHQRGRFGQLLATSSAALLVVATVSAGEEGLFPIFLVDPDTDQVYRGDDEDGDRNYNASAEMIVFYDDTIGTLALDEPTTLHTSPDDFLFIGDSGLDRILTMEDLNDDGDCHDTGEHFIYVDAGNGSGVGLPHINSVSIRLLGQVWAASSNTSVSENDAILAFEDLNADGDANDPGEAREYYVIAPGGAVGDSVPTAVLVHPDGLVYYLENGSTGALAKGVYCLDDVNGNGTIETPGEVFPFYLPAGGGMDLVSLDADEAGVIYVGDNGNDRIFRLDDADANGTITPGLEDCIWFTAAASSNSPDLTVSNDGHEVMAIENLAPQRLFLMEDENDDCFIDPFGERLSSYNENLGDVAWDAPSGIDWDFHGHEEVGTAYCFGIKGRCPCNNDGGVGTGCQNSTGAGAVLEGEGTASVSLDDLEFHAVQLPNGTTTILFQANNAVNGGMGSPFFDGLLCATGGVRRLGARFATASGEAMWGPGILAGPGDWSVGDTRYFQTWFRNVIGPCGNFANTSNGVEITFEQ
jgi:hypothetical protein